MAAPLLTTKFFIPHLYDDLVPRPRLIEQLNAGLCRKLLLVSAPAGFGKTTVVANWVRHELPGDYQGQVAWLSLDENDDELTRFLVYFIAALGNVEPGMGEELRTVLSVSQNPQIEILLTLLVNEIASIDKKIIFVFDDYHVISSSQIHQAIQFLIDHQPPNLLFVITTRDEPFLPLSRLRARGQMIDLRANDLKFSHQEATHYLNQIIGLGLSDADILDLSTRTEGWITGLHLAALSIQDQANPRKFIAKFTGDDRYIIDYLVDEVLSRRSEESREFLLRTSILNRLNSALCETIAQQECAQETLQRLEQENIFIVPLDNRRQWYRYHHLFADVLHQRLAVSASPDEIKKLHQSASQWFDENGFLIEAVEHMLKAEEYGEVIRLINASAEEMFINSQLNTLLQWHGKIPHGLIETYPRLCLIFAWAWVATGELEDAEHCLQAAEKALGVSLDDLLCGTPIDAVHQGALLETAVVRAQLAIGCGNIPEALKLTSFALPYLEESDCPYLYNPPIGTLMAAFFIRGLAQKLLGDPNLAEKSFEKAGELGKKLNHVHIVALAYGHLASVKAIQGCLCQALETCQQGLEKVQEMTEANSPLSGFLRAIYGNLLYERNDLESAEAYIQEALAVAKPWNFVDAFVPGYTGLAQIRVAQGDWEAAFAALDELETLGQNNPQLVKPIADAYRVLLWSRQNEIEKAQKWVESSGLDIDGEIPYSHEDEFIILAQVLIALGLMSKAAGVIDHLLEFTKSGERGGCAIQLLVLRALVFHAQGEQDQAIDDLQQALKLAKPEGYMRTFADQGEPIAALLREIISKSSQQDDNRDYARKILAAINPVPVRERVLVANALIDPLSERELEVLQMMNTDLSGPEIAQELVIALSTLRTHTQQIYRKLGVKNRRAALIEAKKLQLL